MKAPPTPAAARKAHCGFFNFHPHASFAPRRVPGAGGARQGAQAQPPEAQYPCAGHRHSALAGLPGVAAAAPPCTHAAGQEDSHR
eukprot:scaffold1373_cov367-Pinguiococcus_pyrenoidosus.AAC.24